MDPDTPIPLILEQLRSNMAWELIAKRIESMIDKRQAMLVNMKPDAAPTEYQRIIGQIEAFRTIVKQPELLQSEWERMHKQTTTTARATR